MDEIIWTGKNIYDIANFLGKHVTECFIEDNVILDLGGEVRLLPPGSKIIKKDNTYFVGENNE